MVCKEKCFQLSKTDNGRETFYISLGAADDTGIPFEYPSIFDLLTAEEMKHTDVHPINVHDLVEFCANQDPTKYSNESHVYDLLECFIEQNTGANIIMDEFPITKMKGTYN